MLMFLNTFIFVFRDTSLQSLIANFTEDHRTPVIFLSVFFIANSPMKHLFILANHRARDVPDLGARKGLTYIIPELFVINGENHSGNNFRHLSILYAHDTGGVH